MTKIIELAHALGEEIAKSDEIKNLEAAKAEFQTNAELQAKMSEYETERILLGQEFSKETDEADQKAIEGCCAYITAEAEKKEVKGCAVIADDEVFGWAIHYFDENLSAPATAPAAKVTTTADPDVMRVTPEKAVKTPKAKKVDEVQLTLW